MTSFHKSVSTKKSQEEKENSAVAKLEQFLFERRAARQPVDDLEEFERELHSLFATAEAEVVGHEVNRFDVDRPFVTVNGVVHHQVLRCEDTYFCASGPVKVMRSLYSTRKESERAICPMELQAGLVEGRWTPHAAKHLPLLPYLRTGTAPGTEPRRSCRELGRSDGLPPVLRPRLASGLLRVPFRLVLGEGCGLALASAP